MCHGEGGEERCRTGVGEQEAEETAGEVGSEKLVLTKGPGLIGKGIMNYLPRLGIGLGATSSFLSGAAELAGAAFTPFGTAAMNQAQKSCACQQSGSK